MKKIPTFLVAIPFVLLFVFCSFSGSNSDDKSLHFFIQDETDFYRSCQAMERNNNMIYLLFEKAKFLNKDANGIWYDKALKIKLCSADLCRYIEQIKSGLKARAMNIPEKTADTLRSSLLNDPGDDKIPTHYMIGTDPSNVTGKSKELKTKMAQYHKLLVELADSSGTNRFSERMDYLLCHDVYSPGDKKIISWEQNNFYEAPMVVVLARLTAIKQNVMIAEGDAIKEIYSNVKMK